MHEKVSPVVLDFRGLRCPMPLLKLKQALRGMPPGTVCRAMSTDPGSRADIASWCKAAGHWLVSVDEPTDAAGVCAASDLDPQTAGASGSYAFTIRVGGAVGMLDV